MASSSWCTFESISKALSFTATATRAGLGDVWGNGQHSTLLFIFTIYLSGK